MQESLLLAITNIGLYSCQSEDPAPPNPPTIDVVFPIEGTWRNVSNEAVFYQEIIFCEDETGSGTKYEYDKERKGRTGTFVYTYNSDTKELSVITSVSKKTYTHTSPKPKS